MIWLNYASGNYLSLLLGIVRVLEAGEWRGGVVVDDALESRSE